MTIKARLTKLEQRVQVDQRVTEVHLVDAVTGEVGAVLHVGKHTNTDEVMKALEFKHETDPPRKLVSRRVGNKVDD